MILRKIDINLYKVIYTNDETGLINSNPNLIYTTDEDDSYSGYYMLDANGKYVPDDAKELEEIKSIKLQEVKNSFENSLQHGILNSSLGFPVDNRRYLDKNDKDNVQGLIDLNIPSVEFNDSNGNFHTLTLSDLILLKSEMIQDGLKKYQDRWNLENSIKQCSTIDELLLISTQ